MDLAIPHRGEAYSAEESAAKADPDTETTRTAVVESNPDIRD
jgi:hypothetical protein